MIGVLLYTRAYDNNPSSVPLILFLQVKNTYVGLTGSHTNPVQGMQIGKYCFVHGKGNLNMMIWPPWVAWVQRPRTIMVLTYQFTMQVSMMYSCTDSMSSL